MERESFEDEDTAAAHERALRVHQARPRGAARPRLDLHGGLPGHDRQRRLAAERVPARPSRCRSTPAPTSRPSRGWACRAGARCSRRWPRPGRSAPTRSGPTPAAVAERLRGGALLEPSERAARGGPRSTRRSRPCARSYDRAHGGFGGAPKFPPASAIEFLLRRGERDMSAAHPARDGGRRHLRPGRRRLPPLHGGRRWLVPHFEKMLYDNALLARAYLHGWQVTRRPAVAARCRGDPRLGAAGDARAGGRLLLGARRRLRGRGGPLLRVDARRAARGPGRARPTRRIAWFGATQRGNFEGANILGARRRAEPDGPRRSGARRLYEVRAQRVWPGLDDKRLTAWNALVISALADAGAALERDDYLDAARAGPPSSCSATCATARAGCCARARTARAH